MPLIRGTGGQSATAERYTTAASGPKMPSPVRKSKCYSNVLVLVLVGRSTR